MRVDKCPRGHLITGRSDMCEKGNCCQKPEQLKGKPRDCSPDQIKKCHRTKIDHPCVANKKIQKRRRLSERGNQ